MSKEMTPVFAVFNCSQAVDTTHESRPVNTGVKNDKGPSTDTGVILDTAEQSKLWDPD